jgi:hypothetical protein
MLCYYTMNHSSTNRSLFSLCAVLLALVACSTPGPAALGTPTPLFGGVTTAMPSMLSATGEPGAAPPVQSQGVVPPAQQANTFAVAVIVDKISQNVTREQAQAIIAEASGYLREFSPIGLAMRDFAEDSSGGSSVEIANRYIAAHASALPDGLVIFSYGENGEAKTNGGYGYAVPAPAGFKNAFVSPASGDSQLYVAVVDYSYKYMACGYGGGDQLTSASSLPGECRGQTGVACVQNNGYSMCPNAVGNLYTSTPTHAVASGIVHGLLHNFGPNGAADHYAAPECSARMGYPAGYFDLQESEYYNGLCPFVYEEFTEGYRP